MKHLIHALIIASAIIVGERPSVPSVPSVPLGTGQSDRVYGVVINLSMVEEFTLGSAKEVAALTLDLRRLKKITMPCGHVFDPRDADLGDDILCPCGNPGHWFFKRQK